MTRYTPRYIVLRSGGLLSSGAVLYELRQAKSGSTWTPDPLAPEYVEKASGNYADIREVAHTLNEQDAKLLEVQAAVTEVAPAPAPRPKVTVKAATLHPCLYRGCRGIAAPGKAFCTTHSPRTPK